MPNQPRTDNPARAIRVPDELWQAAQERAGQRGETVSEAVRRFLERYVRMSEGKPMSAGNTPSGWPATPKCKHRDHYPGEWYYACCACSGVPGGCEHCETDWDGAMLHPEGLPE